MGLIARPWVDITLIDKEVRIIEAGILQSHWMLVSLQIVQAPTMSGRA